MAKSPKANVLSIRAWLKDNAPQGFQFETDNVYLVGGRVPSISCAVWSGRNPDSARNPFECVDALADVATRLISEGLVVLFNSGDDNRYPILYVFKQQDNDLIAYNMRGLQFFSRDNFIVTFNGYAQHMNEVIENARREKREKERQWQNREDAKMERALKLNRQVTWTVRMGNETNGLAETTFVGESGLTIAIFSYEYRDAHFGEGDGKIYELSFVVGTHDDWLNRYSVFSSSSVKGRTIEEALMKFIANQMKVD